jgi:NAD(P)H-nitrite reductase large subunit
MSTVADIGVALKAGTNCGSCIPEIEEILRAAGQSGLRFESRTPSSSLRSY